MRKVLIIEDDGLMAYQEQFILNKEHFEVIVARTGTDGLNKALIEHPDLIILDLILPDINGREVLSTLRADVWGATVPVIIFTNFNTNENKDFEAVDNKLTYYYLKVEVDPIQLSNRIKEILRI